MNPGQRQCQIIGHQVFLSSYICTFDGCDQQLRWVCQECMRKQIHIHSQQNQDHIMNKEEFIVFLDSRIKSLQQQINDPQNLIKKYLDQLSQLMEKVCLLIDYLEETNNVKNFINDLQRMSQLAVDSFYQIDNKDICKIYGNLNIQKYDDDILTDKLDAIINQIIELQNENKQIKQQKNQKYYNKQQILSEKQVSYKYLEYLNIKQDMLISTSSISGNEQYLTLGGIQKKLLTYNLKSGQLLQTIQLDQPIQVAKFSKDSNLIYVGCQEGYLYSFDIKNNFQVIYKKQIHNIVFKSNIILNLIEKQNSIIIASIGDGSIIIINIFQNKEIKRINSAHQSGIFGLDYNLSEDIIATSAKKCIKLFKGSDFTQIIDNQNAHSEIIIQLQLIDNSQLLSLGNERLLKIWFIDYKNCRMIQLNQIQNQLDIRSFSSVLNNEQILLICKSIVLVIDLNFQIIYQFDHTSGDFVLGNDTRQLNSMNYIIINETFRVKIMKNASIE